MAKQKGNGVIQRMSHYRPTPMLVTQPYHYNSRQLLSRSVLAVYSRPRDVARVAIFVRFPSNIGVARNQSAYLRLLSSVQRQHQGTLAVHDRGLRIPFAHSVTSRDLPVAKSSHRASTLPPQRRSSTTLSVALQRRRLQFRSA